MTKTFTERADRDERRGERVRDPLGDGARRQRTYHVIFHPEGGFKCWSLRSKPLNCPGGLAVLNIRPAQGRLHWAKHIPGE